MREQQKGKRLWVAAAMMAGLWTVSGPAWALPPEAEQAEAARLLQCARHYEEQAEEQAEEEKPREAFLFSSFVSLLNEFQGLLWESATPAKVTEVMERRMQTINVRARTLSWSRPSGQTQGGVFGPITLLCDLRGDRGVYIELGNTYIADGFPVERVDLDAAREDVIKQHIEYNA